mmetsp:Transcript_90732/g.228184  ORF Transcript_90732/g.228184 Transcript_90732/m.228184 type:complete len:243 (-) Transcript_90732:198-926(-)
MLLLTQRSLEHALQKYQCLQTTCCTNMETDGELKVVDARSLSQDGEVLDAMQHGPDTQVFEARLVRQQGKLLGLDFEYVPDRLALPIRAVTGHLASEWNMEHPSLRMRTGDRVVDVNGVNRNAANMLQALRSLEHHVLNITFVRLANWKDMYDEEFVIAFETQTAATLLSAPLTSTSAPSSVRTAHEASEAVTSRGQQEEMAGNEDANLPEPWTAVWSSTWGLYYYFDPKTGVSTWEKPVDD